MLKKKLLFLCVLFVVFISPISSFAGGKITLATLDWEPYIGQKLENNGFVSEIVHEAYKRGGYEVTDSFLPWARVVKMAEEGKVDGYYPEYYAEELKEKYIVSDPYPGGPLGFFKLKSNDVKYSTIEDLKPYRIGVVRGYVNTAAFDSADYLKKDEAVDDNANIRKLLASRIDMFVADKYVGIYLMQQSFKNDMDKVEFMDPPLEMKDLFVCIGKQIKNSQELMDVFNKGLKSMIEDGTLKTIMQKHGF
ncbi:MAG: transporter substrate-binding domain-containing protein [Desulfobacterales bacterium]|nr:transporter substrate-binding domain-containing protein [Desulfobacterales bacterium]